jgi:hypothetical protein
VTTLSSSAEITRLPATCDSAPCVYAEDVPIERASIDEMFVDVSAHCSGDALLGARLAERAHPHDARWLSTLRAQWRGTTARG